MEIEKATILIIIIFYWIIAGNLILRTGELTLIDAITSVQVIAEAERYIAGKLPKALPALSTWTPFRNRPETWAPGFANSLPAGALEQKNLIPVRNCA